MEVNVYNIKGEDTGRKVTLNESIFGIEPNDHAIYLDVKQFMANQRQGTHKSKERSEISGSTRKIGRQKGGGGARRGDMNSPVLVGGARVFGPKPRDYFFKLNKKVKTLARKSALSYKAQNDAIIVVEDFTFEEVVSWFRTENTSTTYKNRRVHITTTCTATTFLTADLTRRTTDLTSFFRFMSTLTLISHKLFYVQINSVVVGLNSEDRFV